MHLTDADEKKPGGVVRKLGIFIPLGDRVDNCLGWAYVLTCRHMLYIHCRPIAGELSLSKNGSAVILKADKSHRQRDRRTDIAILNLWGCMVVKRTAAIVAASRSTVAGGL